MKDLQLIAKQLRKPSGEFAEIGLSVSRGRTASAN